MTSKLESWRRAAYNAEECLTGCLASPEIAKHLDQATARTILQKLHQARIEMLAASEEATQPAAGEPEQQTAINADDLPTKKYPLGALDFDAPVAAGDPIQVEAVAVTREDEDGLYLDWVLEGGISALEAPGVVLLVAHGTVTDDQGSGEVYLAPPAAAHGDEAVLTFEYVGPRNERKTVEVTREEVADHLDYMLFEKLTAAVCGCDPAESDDCRCDEYAEQFTMRAQAGEGGE